MTGTVQQDVVFLLPFAHPGAKQLSFFSCLDYFAVPSFLGPPLISTYCRSKYKNFMVLLYQLILRMAASVSKKIECLTLSGFNLSFCKRLAAAIACEGFLDQDHYHCRTP